MFTEKQNDPTISQLFQHYKSSTSASRNFFQNTLNQLSSKPIDTATALSRIRDEDILNLENFSLILKHFSPFEMASALIQLHNSDLSNSENEKLLEKHRCPEGVALVLRLLHSTNLLSLENRTAIQKKNLNLYMIASILLKLYEANLLTQKNLDCVLALPCLETISNSLHKFDRYNPLTQTMFEQLMHTQQEKKFSYR